MSPLPILPEGRGFICSLPNPLPSLNFFGARIPLKGDGDVPLYYYPPPSPGLPIVRALHTGNIGLVTYLSLQVFPSRAFGRGDEAIHHFAPSPQLAEPQIFSWP